MPKRRHRFQAPPPPDPQPRARAARGSPREPRGAGRVG